MFTDANISGWDESPSRSRGIVVSDIDGDGRFELLIGGNREANQVWKWNGTSLFDVTPRELASPKTATLAIAAGDLDGDGREEIYLHSADVPSGVKSNADQLMRCNVHGKWEDLFAGALSLRNFYAARRVLALDRRGTGRYGFLFGNIGRPMRLYEMVQDRQLADLAPAVGLSLAADVRGLWAGPLMTERIDLLCGIHGGMNAAFACEKLPGFRDLAGLLNLGDVAENAHSIAVFDADGDGRLDVVLGNWDGPNRLMIRQPDGTFKDRATPAMAMPGLIRNLIAADFDNDGYEELFFQFHGEANRLFRRNETGDWRMIDPGSAGFLDGLGSDVCSTDLDGDGVLELVLLQGAGEPAKNRLYKVLEAAKNGWLRILPETRFGAPARGAVVRLTAGDRTQVRVIDGGSSEPVAHFGLGQVEIVDSVRISWPDGAHTTLVNLDARQMLRVGYPS